MVARIRQAFQTGVNLFRALVRTSTGRHVSDLAVLAQAEAVHEAVLALQDNFINPDPAAVAAVVQEIRRQIGGLDAGRMRGDVSGLDDIKSSVSRLICEQQLDLIDRLHLLQAVVLGVEQGLRDLIEARPVTDRRIRDGPVTGAQTERPAVRQRRATAKDVAPVRAAGRGSEKGSQDPTGEAPAQDHRTVAELRGTDREGPAPDAKGGSRTKPGVSARPDTGGQDMARRGVDTGTRPIAADTPDL